MELDIIGKRIKGIRALLQKVEDKNFCRSVSIFFEGKERLIAVINADTDEVIIDYLKEGDLTGEVTGIEVYPELVDKQIVSYWVANNHLGYCDLFALAIDEFKPTLLIASLGSSLNISLCNYLEM